MIGSDFTTLGLALGLGLLVGLQRERTQSRIAGIRTFTIITLFGTISAFIAKHFDHDLVIAFGAVAIALLLAAANLIKQKADSNDIGQTTEMAALLMYGVGAYLVIGSQTVGVVVGAVVALLLYLKEYFENIISRLGEKDIKAIMLFVAISLVILPVLPDQDFGPYEVFNPREIWLMVVLIVGLSIAGYFAYKWLGKNIGTGLNGILGGLISSTATTVTYSRLAKNTEGTTNMAAFVIMAASTVAFIRVIIEVSVVAPGYLSTVAPPLLIITVFMAIISAGLFFFNKSDGSDQDLEPSNPAQFKTAIIFAILYAVILLAVAFVKDKFGQSGLYLLSIISGLTDVDAITLSISNMMKSERIAGEDGWELILIAALSNLVFKGGMAAFIGPPKLMKYIIPAFGATLVAGGLVIWLW